MFRNASVGIAAVALFSGLLGLLLLVGSLVTIWMRALTPTGYAITQPAPTLSADFVTERIQLSSKGYRLEGCIVRSNLTGRLAAVIYNHGSEKNPQPCG